MTRLSRIFRLRGGMVTATLALAAVVASESASARLAKPPPPADQPAASVPAKPTPAPVPSEPGVTTASYGDWVMRCQRGGDVGKPIRACEATQIMQLQGQAQPIAQIAIGHVNAADPLDVTIVLPPNVTLPSGVRIVAGSKEETGGFELQWRRCLPGACVAQSRARDDVLARWRVSDEPGRIEFKNAAGQDVAIPLSFRGLAPALDALAKESSY